MSRWLRAAREGPSALTKPTEPTEPLSVPPVGEVLSVLSVLSGGGEGESESLTDRLAAWEERAAIREYDGGQSREVAEREAAREVRVMLAELERSRV